MPNAYAQIAFTPRVRAEQERFGSAETYGRLLERSFEDGAVLTAREAAFIAARDGVFQASVSETGWPYVQFRGGTPGFLKVIDERTIAYADFAGNKQYISTGNLRHDDRMSILAIDFARRQRLKLMGRARISEDRALIDHLSETDGPAAERAIIITVEAYMWNCPQHIPLRRTDAEMGGEIARLTARVETLEDQLALARAAAPSA